MGAYVSGDLSIKEYHKKSPRQIFNMKDANSVVDLQGSYMIQDIASGYVHPHVPVYTKFIYTKGRRERSPVEIAKEKLDKQEVKDFQLQTKT